MLPFLKVPDRKAVLFQPYKMPEGVERKDTGIRKSLGFRRKKTGMPFRPYKSPSLIAAEAATELLPEPTEEDEEPEAAEDAAAASCAAPASIEPPTWAPLVLWKPEEGAEGTPVEVDGVLCKFLREHQREGVQFMVRLHCISAAICSTARICMSWLLILRCIPFRSFSSTAFTDSSLTEALAAFWPTIWG